MQRFVLNRSRRQGRPGDALSDAFTCAYVEEQMPRGLCGTPIADRVLVSCGFNGPVGGRRPDVKGSPAGPGTCCGIEVKSSIGMSP
jgi:hypothetical protein